jgi:hypothetical protein
MAIIFYWYLLISFSPIEFLKAESLKISVALK